MSNSYIMHRVAWTLISTIFPANFFFISDMRTADGWFLAALLLVHLGFSCTSDYSCSFQNPTLAPQLPLQLCLTKCPFTEISRYGSELLPATLMCPGVLLADAGWLHVLAQQHWVHPNLPRFLNQLLLNCSRSGGLWLTHWSPINWIIGHFPLLYLASAFIK